MPIFLKNQSVCLKLSKNLSHFTKSQHTTKKIIKNKNIQLF